MQPVISVVTATYNRPDMLCYCLASVATQTFGDIEHIIVNDGGEDVGELIKSAEDPRIKYITQENKGLSAARNAGIAAATGEYICFLDDDDLYYAIHLEWLLHHITKQEVAQRTGIVYGDAYRTNIKDGVVYSRDIEYSYPFDKNRFLIENYVPVCCFLFKRSLLEKTGVFDENLHNVFEDWDLWIRMAWVADQEFAHIRRATCEYTWDLGKPHMVSTENGTDKFFEARQYIYRKYKQFTSPQIKEKQEEILQRAGLSLKEQKRGHRGK